ncbi:MAG: DUF2213 domain-containing protein [Bacteroidales bacterium]|nr:DUF2213 domain-containing protein [Bacteroidales bacterium]
MFYRFKVSNAETHRHKDENGYITVDESPILCAGVLEYYGSELTDGGADEIDGRKIDPDKVYKVYVPEEEMRKAADTFKLLPIVNGHEWLGQDGADAHDHQEGSTGEHVEVRDGFLYVPLKFTGDGIIADLESGDKEELSASYTNKLSWASNSDDYDLVASDIKGNHVALVDKGRCGPDVRVLNQQMESKKMKTNNELKLVIDGKEVDLAQFFKQEEKEEAHADTGAIEDTDEKRDDVEPREDEESREDNEESVDKRALIDEIGGMLKGKVDDELIRTIIGKAEKIAYDGSESSESDNELPDDVEEKFEGEDDDKEVENGCKAKNEDGEDCQEKREDVSAKVANAMAKRDAALRRAYNEASDAIGEFNPFGMTERSMYVKALNHLGVSTTGKETVGELRAMVRVANSQARVDNGFSYSADGAKDTVSINI